MESSSAPIAGDDVPSELRPLFEALRNSPDVDRRLASLLRKLGSKVAPEGARRLAVRLREHAPDDMYVWSATEPFIRTAVPSWHFEIVRDGRRNRTYDEALRASVQHGSSVLEIGTGSGILAMMAARAGAGHVYTIEIEPLLAEAARRNIADNGFQDRITVINKDAMSVVGVDLPHRCDAVVHEIISSDLLAEGVLPLLNSARANLLVPDALYLPRHVAAHGMLIGDDVFDVGSTTQCQEGLSLSGLDRLGKKVRAKNGPLEIRYPLSLPSELLRFDLACGAEARDANATVKMEVVGNGLARGILQWISFSFPDGREYANPPDVASCWSLRLYPFAEPLPVSEGRQVEVHVQAIDDLLVVGPPLVR
ncbi:MAG: 50S ribosomal protein L11 methyltransferase [Hyphomicrobiaceae bacterium]